MKSNLMVIESPNKIKTISKYLGGKDFALKATVGHFQELVSFDRKSLVPEFSLVPAKKANMQAITKLANEAQKIYLATDPDREGEGIAWHVYRFLTPRNQKKCCRISFNEITAKAIATALKTPQAIDQNMVNAYLARIILDQEIGYKLSHFVQQKLAAKSAGRVQSVVLKLIADRKAAIENFVVKTWFTVNVTLDLLGVKLKLKLIELGQQYSDLQVESDHKTEVKFWDLTQAEPLKVITELEREWELVKLQTGIAVYSQPPPAFKTSTLQILMTKKFKLAAKTAESLLQKLYHGIEINGSQTALITYPRTDLTDLSADFIVQAKKVIIERFGPDYYFGARKAKTKNKVQGAHEGIRPTDLSLTPQKMRPYVDDLTFKTYELIYNAALSSLMAAAKIEQTNFWFQNNHNQFLGVAKKLLFDGYWKLLKPNINPEGGGEEEKGLKQELLAEEMVVFKTLPELHNLYQAQKVALVPHESQPPKNYSQSSLIKVLEKVGVGRPSTYATSVTVNLNRGYVTENEQKELIISATGEKVNQILTTTFPDLIHETYTAKMEQALDEIWENRIDYPTFLSKTFRDFHAVLNQTGIPAFQAKPPPKILSQTKCPKCKNALVVRTYADKKTQEQKTFLGCSNYPKCNFTKF